MRRRRTGAFHADSIEDYLEKVKESDNMAVGATRSISPTNFHTLENKPVDAPSDNEPYLDLKQMISRSYSGKSNTQPTNTDKPASPPNDEDTELSLDTGENKSPIIMPVDQDCLSSDPETVYVESLIVKIMVMGTQEVKRHTFIHSVIPGGELEECLAVKSPLDFVVKIDKGEERTVNYHFWVKECNRESELERFKCIYSTYYKSVSSFIFLYNVTDMESFTTIRSSIQEVKRAVSKEFKGILIGLTLPSSYGERKVKFEEGQSLADQEGLREFIETDLANALVNQRIMTFISSTADAQQSKLKSKKS